MRNLAGCVISGRTEKIASEAQQRCVEKPIVSTAKYGVPGEIAAGLMADYASEDKTFK